MSKPEVILVMGVTGVGKSTFIQYATGYEVKIGHTLDPCTARVQHYQVPGTNVYLLDTPGFDDPNMTDTSILTMISDAMEEAFNDEGEIRGALYIHPITDPRMKRSAMTNLLMFKNIIGMDNMANVLLVTTKWSLQPRAELEDHERDLATDSKYWKRFLDRGSAMARFADSQESALEILKPLVRGKSFTPQLLKERVYDKLSIPQTEAGKVVNDNIQEAVDAGKREVAQLDAEWKEAMRNKETEWAAELEEEKRERQAELDRREDEGRELEKLRSNRRGRIGRWMARAGAAIGGTVATIASGGLLAPAALAWYAVVETGAQAHRHNTRR